MAGPEVDLARIKTLIGRRFHKSMTLSGISQMLRRHGWSHQVPARRALERNEGSGAGSGDRFGHAAWRAGVVMTVSNSTGVSRPSAACLRRRW